MGRKFLKKAKKNYERKRWGFFPIRIPLKGGVSVFKVSIPVSALSSQQLTSVRSNQTASTSCSSSAIEISVSNLRKEIQTEQLPPGWYVAPETSESDDVVICYRDKLSLSSVYTLTISSGNSWSLTFRGVTLSPENSTILLFPSKVSSSTSVVSLVKSIHSCCVCSGNSDKDFIELSKSRNGYFVDRSGSEIAKQEDTFLQHPTIRHKNCPILLPTAATRCWHCSDYRHTLRSLSSKHSTADKTAPDSHVNYRFLSSAEKLDRLKRMHSQIRSSRVLTNRLKAKLELAVEKEGITVDNDTHDDLCAIMDSVESDALSSHAEDSFQHLFWKQQQQASQYKNSRSMRWHPLFIKWCLYLRHVSGRAYETVRKVIKLPSQRTLRDYTHYINAATGFSDEVDQQLYQTANLEQCGEHEKYISIIFDEMYIKEDLVFDKHTHALIGFTNLGDTNRHLLKFEESLASDSTQLAPLAKTVLVLMVRGLCSALEFPYVQFACSSVKGDLLFQPFWESVRRLEYLGLKVLATTADGASSNRRFFRLHSPNTSSDDMQHYVDNPFTPEDRPIYFISDVPHLMKTARNALANSRRMLWCKGKELKWQHILDLYTRNAGAKTSTPGLSLLPKLTYEHVFLTSFSKMRVDLAAEVLSGSVHNALLLTGGDVALGTAEFVGFFDKFFDSLNVNSFTSGKRNRKAFQSPYRSGNDFRLKWLEEDFIGYLNKWEDSVNALPGLKKSEKSKMLLSPETRLGLRMTVKSFVKLVKFLFTVPGVTCFLSEKLSQDPLEKFFGCQRQRGGVNENPTVKEFCKNTQALRVINSACQNVSRGNCRGNRGQSIDWEKENTPLPKRRRTHK